MSLSLSTVALRIRQAPSLEAFQIRDFRLLWFGAFLSFCGSWIQTVAQGWLVFNITHSEFKLALVSFCGMAPVSLFGPFAGTLADTLNRRVVLITTQALFAAGALFLAAATFWGFVQYWHILAVALVLGIVAAVEMPTRQSLVSAVVPPQLISRAVPINAMTFNGARLIGPAIGAVILAKFGASMSYFVNGISFAALIFAVTAIRADLSAVRRAKEPISDLLLGGMRYTFRDVRLRTLFLMETTVSGFGLFYLALMPAIAKVQLGLGKEGLGVAMTFIGIGAMAALITLMFISHLPIKTFLVRLSMTLMGISLVLLAFAKTLWIAYILLAIAGMSGVVQFNTTNTLFQLLSPQELRGRVLAMHIWALSGLGPFGTLFFGWLAQAASIPIALWSGGSCVVIGATLGWIHRGRLQDTVATEGEIL